MTYISRKSRLLVPHWSDECEPSYLYWVNRRRSDGRLKRHTSCDDLRAWVDDEHLNYKYFLEVMTDGEDYQRFLGVIGRFIPVKTILDFLCGNMKSREDKKESEQDDQQQKQRTNKAFDQESILSVLDCAMAKLESIQCIVHTNEYDRCIDQDICTCDENGSSNIGRDNTCLNHMKLLQYNNRSVSNFRFQTSTIEGENTNEEEDYVKEYDETMKKMLCLKNKLNVIQEQKEELEKKIEASQRTASNCSHGITELYNKNEEINLRKLQMQIKKIITQKNPILNEMCQALKHLRDIKKIREQNLKSENKPKKKWRGSLCAENEIFSSSDQEKSSGKSGNLRKLTCLKDPDKNMNEWTRKNFDGRNKSLSSSKYVSDSNEESSNFEKSKSVLFDEEYMKTFSYLRKKRNPKIMNGNLDPKTEEVSSLNTNTISADLLPNKESQGTYNVSNVIQSIPNKKFKSETTMTEIEQTLRNYEERLKDLDCLEDQVYMLKKEALLANKFRKSWLNVCMKNRSQKVADMNKTSQLRAENSDLRKILQWMVIKSKKNQMKILQLHCRKSHMEQLIKKVKSKLNKYEITLNTQKNYICKLEATVSIQKDEIEKLMSQIGRMCLVDEEIKEAGKSVKNNVQSSHLYSPAHAKSEKFRKVSNVASSDEEILKTSHCCSCNSTSSDCLISEGERNGNGEEYPCSTGKCHCN